MQELSDENFKTVNQEIANDRVFRLPRFGATGAGWTMRDAYSRWAIEMTLKGKTFPQ